ncbi:Conserved hypothetical protein [Vibrio nigripulchritudo SFn27]|nr:hypothetical protein [Vibrio nigripulchritudo]CCN83293.1 Conserved hypothetical protein [Vibrio nigripulchritudo BLFn1]CCN86803.1 Conserved hypothetical protein [Vibrio nigripulchritudo SFn27]CCN95380.1 Conserved hypothetical protein [Vibrio nigripulchritudo ENn2]CCO41537.1 Conserved hypothetical protein [Vibrio nigripulchritudo SFn135]CCO53512.1 Conserved hypothetical protein [Vibrio nigripulchritudo Wn13]
MSSGDRSLKTLITTMPIVEISAYFSIDRLLPELNWVADAAVNATNVEKVQAIQTNLKGLVSRDSISAPLTLTFAVMGKPKLSNSSNRTSSLTYDSSDTYIVGNVLGVVAICKILGLKTFLFSSRLSVKEANSKSELRQRLAMESVEIRVIFDEQRGLSSADVIELFKQSHISDSSMSLPHIADAQGVISDENYPLRPLIKELITKTGMELYGGVNFDAKHVKVSERYIATEYVLFKTIVGAVAGVGTQEYSKMSKDITLSSGESISSVLSGGYIDFVTTFMKGWLKPLREAFAGSRSGYHLSPQVWQALGLTIYQLVSDGALCEDLKIAGEVLGQLDYSKNAKHWSNCSVMELDSKGRIYKNSAGSTRQFRVGLFEYFFAVLNAKKER